MRSVAAHRSRQFRNDRRVGNVGIEEIVAILIVEAYPGRTEHSCFADVAASVVLSRSLESHSFGGDVTLVDSVDLI